MTVPPGRLVHVLDADPGLADMVPADERAAAREAAVAPVLTLPEGAWDPLQAEADRLGAHLGLLILDGLMARRLMIERLPSTELLGPGDVLRPWIYEDAQGSVLAQASWEVMDRTELAVLDRRFMESVRPWPQITGAVLERSIRRSRSLSFQLAVCHLRRVDARLLVSLWHYADRFGRVTADGVILPLRLTHKLLASIIGAQRPTVTTALTELARRGLVERRADGTWVLHGPPPSALGGFDELEAELSAG